MHMGMLRLGKMSGGLVVATLATSTADMLPGLQCSLAPTFFIELHE